MAKRRGVGYYGFPSEAGLATRAMRLAEGSVPTARSVRRRYDVPIGDVTGFTSALVGLLRGSDPGGAYDEEIAGLTSMNQAAQQRLAALGPEYAGAGVAAGSSADSALGRLMASKAGAQAHARQQPGIAASRGALAKTGLVNAREEALTQRQEALRSSFLQAYEQVRSNALAIATANAEIDQSDRAYQEQVRQFNTDIAMRAAEASGAAAAKPPDINEDFQQIRGDAFSMAEKMHGRTKSVPVGLPGEGKTEKRPDPVSYGQAFQRIRANVRPLLRQLGYSNSAITKLIRQALLAAGYPPPPRRPPKGQPPYDWQ